MSGQLQCLDPVWPAPPNVRALTSLRPGGVSTGRYRGLNLGDHVGDEVDAVKANRATLRRVHDLPSEPCWLNQVHGNNLTACCSGSKPVDADASFTSVSGRVCAILTADCLPVLFCNQAGTRVAAAHTGWRGLAAGVLETVLASFEDAPGDVLAWLGPAIGPQSFEVGPEVREIFIGHHASATTCFVQSSDDRFMADIYALARLRLHGLGVRTIHGGEWDTYRDAERFYSYRRDGVTGRMGSFIWLA